MNIERMGMLLRVAAKKKAEQENKYTYKGELKPYAAYRLGKEVGINTSYSYRILHGQMTPSREILIKMCKTLGCSYQDAKEIMDAGGYSLSQNELEEERPSRKGVAA